ncbi:hypothetical protein [Halocola ammonii]
MKKTVFHWLWIISAAPFLMASLNSCTLSYGIANTAEATRYQPKPAYHDKDTSASYVSAYLSHNDGYGYFTNEDIIFGGARFHRAHTFKNFNLAYGAFGYAGSYNVQLVRDLQGEKSFFGGGLSGEANLNIPLFDLFDWRVLGIRATAWGEGGEFARFKNEIRGKELEGSDGYATISDEAPNNFLTNLSLTSELVFKHDNFDLGLNGSYGFSIDPSSENSVILHNYGVGAHFSRGRYTVFGNLNTSFSPYFIFDFNLFVNHYSVGFSYQI